MLQALEFGLPPTAAALDGVDVLRAPEAELQRLALLKRSHADDQYRARRQVKELPEEIEADEAMNVGAANELRARLGEGSTLAARAAIRRGEGASELQHVIYTSCPVCETGDQPPTWSLRARRAVQNRDTRTISYQGAVLEVVGIPVLYLPFIAHPDPSVGRASGFLPPNIGRNRRLGTFYSQPYYWAISDSQDLTATLRLHGNVNPLAGLDYRKRFWSGDLSIDTTFTQEELFNGNGERFGEDLFRYSVFANGGHRVNPMLITRITDSKGRVLNEPKPAPMDESARVLDARTVVTNDSGQAPEMRGSKARIVALSEGWAYLQAGLIVPAQDEALTVKATRSALAKLDVDPSRLLN